MAESNQPKQDIGKFPLINELTQSFTLKQPNTITGVGDDAAVLDTAPDGAFYTLLTTELLVEKVHFDFTYCPLKHIGYKAVVAGIADITAMNGIPQQITVGLALHNQVTVSALKEIYDGIEKACTHYNLDLVGGDTTTSSTGLVISITAVGKVNKELLATRKGAKPYDLIGVTGDLGAAYVGLQILNREKKICQEDPNLSPKLTPYPYVLGRQLKPEARTDVVKIFQDIKFLPTSLIDVSSGLATELLQLGKASEVGLVVYEEKIPIAPETYATAEELGLSPTLCALHGGEDYELLFTFDPKDLHKIESKTHFHLIGYVAQAEKGMQMVTTSNQAIALTAQGF